MRTLATLENRVYRQMLTNPCRHHLTLEDVAAAAVGVALRSKGC